MNFLNNWKVTLLVAIFSLFMGFASGDYTFIVFFFVLLLMTYFDFKFKRGDKT